jgi:hypothetical protein
MKPAGSISKWFVLYCVAWVGFAASSLVGRWPSPFSNSRSGVISSGSRGYGYGYKSGRSTGGSWGGGK